MNVPELLQYAYTSQLVYNRLNDESVKYKV
jgi:hypothetical protein